MEIMSAISKSRMFESAVVLQPTMGLLLHRTFNSFSMLPISCPAEVGRGSCITYSGCIQVASPVDSLAVPMQEALFFIYCYYSMFVLFLVRGI